MIFIGDDWASDHHDVVFHDDQGRRLAKARLPEGAAGMSRLHALVAEHLPMLADLADLADLEPDTPDAAAGVMVGIETDRGPWVTALVAAGYTVYAINPMQAARYRERHSSSGAKSDTADAAVLADIVRLDRSHHRPVAGDSEQVIAIRALARAHQSAVWACTRGTQQLRATLTEYFPAALTAFTEVGIELHDQDAAELLTRAADPDTAAKLTRSQITKALQRAHRHGVPVKTVKIHAAFTAPGLRQPAAVTAAYAAIVRSHLKVLAATAAQVNELQEVLTASFRVHPDAEIYRSVPGIGEVLGAGLMGEFGDQPLRYASAKARKNYAGTSPVTKASGKKTIVTARYARNDRLADAAQRAAFSSLRASPGGRAYYDALRARGKGHEPALRQLANRWMGILHGCLRTHRLYDEATAWPASSTTTAPTAQAPRAGAALPEAPLAPAA